MKKKSLKEESFTSLSHLSKSLSSLFFLLDFE